jgi:hypothetical protein
MPKHVVMHLITTALTMLAIFAPTHPALAGVGAALNAVATLWWIWAD